MTDAATEESAKPTTPVPAPEQPRQKRNWRPWLWAFPALFLLAVFLLWPVLRTIQISFYDGSVINPTKEFVGVDNYERLLTNDPFFIRRELPPWSALFNSALWVVLFTSGVLGMGMLVAVLADKVRYEKLAKATPQQLATVAGIAEDKISMLKEKMPRDFARFDYGDFR